MRDIRITPIYEGTNGIQALDLLGRKVLGDNGEALYAYLNSIDEFAVQTAALSGMGAFASRLQILIRQTRQATAQLTTAAALDLNEIGAAAHHYLRILECCMGAQG